MLEQLRKSGASIFIYLIFGLLIVIFVINFAPNAGQSGAGCAGATNSFLSVDGENTNQSAYKVAYSGNNASGRQKVYLALELLLRRELLAQAAEERGLRVTGNAVDEEIKQGYFFLGGQRIPANAWMDDIEGEKFFNFGRLKNWVGQLNVSMNSYKDDQARNLQASLMAELLRDSARVSREEALANYLFEHNTVTYDVVTFSPTTYRDAMRLTEADVQRFLATHDAEVKKKFAEEERTYKGTKPALKLRSIFIAKREPAAAPTPPSDAATDAGSAAGAGATTADAKPGAPKVGMPIEQAKATLETARAAIAAGKQKFADAAKRLSTDETAKVTGGELGWRTAENAQLGEKAVSDAVKDLEPGKMTPVIVTDAGAYLVMAEDKREGDLGYDQVKGEIATELAKDVWSKEAAKRGALEAIASARAGTGKNLDELFERGVDPEQQRRMQQQIQEQIQRQMNRQGAVTFESEDVAAAWNADEPPGSAPPGGAASGATPSAGGAPPPAPAAANKPTAAPAQPAAGSASTPAAGSASTPAAGSASTPAAGSAEPAPADAAAPPAADVTPSKDVLPAFATVEKPKVISHGPTPRQKQLPGVGDSKEAATALFDELTPGMLAKQVYESDGTYLVVQLKDKTAPKVEDFDKVAEQELRQLRDLRGTLLLEGWLKQRCEALAKDKRIEPMGELIRETDDEGKPLPTVYRPCMSFR